MAAVELEPQFVQSLKLLHSTNKDSVDQLRSIIDDVIRQKYGPAKMLTNVLHKRYMVEEPSLSDHGNSNSGNNKKSKSSSSSSSKHCSKSSKSNSPVNVPPQPETQEILQSDDTLALEILEDDLTCVMCKKMDVGARNRLVECAECHSLYHQECHTPHILDSQIDELRTVWYCSKCTKDTAIQNNVVKEEISSPKTVIQESKPKDTKKSSKNQKSKSQKSGSKKTK